jgi:hypothetical protein
VFAWSLHGEYFHGVLAFTSEREQKYGGAHLEEGAFIIHHLLIGRGGLVRSG